MCRNNSHVPKLDVVLERLREHLVVLLGHAHGEHLVTCRHRTVLRKCVVDKELQLARWNK